MFKNVGILTGLGYLLAIWTAWKNKWIFNKKDMASMIVGGTLLSYAAGTLTTSIWENFVSGGFIGFVATLVVAFVIWLRAHFMRRGKKQN